MYTLKYTLFYQESKRFIRINTIIKNLKLFAFIDNIIFNLLNIYKINYIIVGSIL